MCARGYVDLVDCGVASPWGALRVYTISQARIITYARVGDYPAFVTLKTIPVHDDCVIHSVYCALGMLYTIHTRVQSRAA